MYCSESASPLGARGVGNPLTLGLTGPSFLFRPHQPAVSKGKGEGRLFTRKKVAEWRRMPSSATYCFLFALLAQRGGLVDFLARRAGWASGGHSAKQGAQTRSPALGPTGAPLSLSQVKRTSCGQLSGAIRNIQQPKASF